jgi:hypothetical protein
MSALGQKRTHAAQRNGRYSVTSSTRASGVGEIAADVERLAIRLIKHRRVSDAKKSDE